MGRHKKVGRPAKRKGHRKTYKQTVETDLLRISKNYAEARKRFQRNSYKAVRQINGDAEALLPAILNDTIKLDRAYMHGGFRETPLYNTELGSSLGVMANKTPSGKPVHVTSDLRHVLFMDKFYFRKRDNRWRSRYKNVAEYKDDYDVVTRSKRMTAQMLGYSFLNQVKPFSEEEAESFAKNLGFGARHYIRSYGQHGKWMFAIEAAEGKHGDVMKKEALRYMKWGLKKREEGKLKLDEWAFKMMYGNKKKIIDSKKASYLGSSISSIPIADRSVVQKFLKEGSIVYEAQYEYLKYTGKSDHQIRKVLLNENVTDLMKKMTFDFLYKLFSNFEGFSRRFKEYGGNDGSRDPFNRDGKKKRGYTDLFNYIKSNKEKVFNPENVEALVASNKFKEAYFNEFAPLGGKDKAVDGYTKNLVEGEAVVHSQSARANIKDEEKQVERYKKLLTEKKDLFDVALDAGFLKEDPKTGDLSNLSTPMKYMKVRDRKTDASGEKMSNKKKVNISSDEDSYDGDVD